MQLLILFFKNSGEGRSVGRGFRPRLRGSVDSLSAVCKAMGIWFWCGKSHGVGFCVNVDQDWLGPHSGGDRGAADLQSVFTPSHY